MRRHLPVLALAFGIAAPLHSQEQQETDGVLGSLRPVIESVQRARGYPLAYEHKGSAPLEEWRKRGRAAVEQALSYNPPAAALDAQTHRTERYRGYELRVMSFAGSAGDRVPLFLLVPEGGQAPYPAVVALHDHGGYFYFGKEKIVEAKEEHPSIVEFKKNYYGGRSYASELARRGFVVAVIDAFYWGERRLQYKSPPPDWNRAVAGLEPGSTQYVDAANRFLSQRTGDLMTHLRFNGMSWAGIILRDDQRTVDVLRSLPFVDGARIGCVGLSGGGFRSTYLAGMDSRIRAAVVTGWMTTLPSIGQLPYSTHVNMFDPPGVHAALDHPDVATLGAPGVALMVQNCSRDRLFPAKGMQDAAEKIRRVYAAEKAADRFTAKTYDVPHSFTAEMQEDAFEWLERWMGK